MIATTLMPAPNPVAEVLENVSFKLSSETEMTITDHMTGTERAFRRDLVTKLAMVAGLMRRHIITGGTIDIDKGLTTSIIEQGEEFLVIITDRNHDRCWQIPVTIEMLEAMAEIAEQHPHILAAA